jgi:ribosome-associated toxin RatA of RatAB toxin-antitoxin module
MITIQHAIEVPYPPPAMYALVKEVSLYPKFVPFCRKGSSKIITYDKLEISSLTFSWWGISESFSTLNTLTKPHRIKMQLVEGPFKTLDGMWQFIPLEESGTLVKLSLRFEFSNPFFDRLLTPIFNTVMQQAMNAFLTRASICYDSIK